MMMNIAISIVYMKIGIKAYITIKSKVQENMLDTITNAKKHAMQEE